MRTNPTDLTNLSCFKFHPFVLSVLNKKIISKIRISQALSTFNHCTLKNKIVWPSISNGTFVLVSCFEWSVHSRRRCLSHQTGWSGRPDPGSQRRRPKSLSAPVWSSARRRRQRERLGPRLKTPAEEPALRITKRTIQRKPRTKEQNIATRQRRARRDDTSRTRRQKPRNPSATEAQCVSYRQTKSGRVGKARTRLRRPRTWWGPPTRWH